MEALANSSVVSSEDSSLLMNAISTTSAKPCEIDAVVSSQQKLQAVAHSLSQCFETPKDAHSDDNGESGTILVHQKYCKTVDDAVGYRCRCAFQIVWSADGKVHYAVRENQVPVVTDTFPVANKRIQKAMEGFLIIVNADCGSSPDTSTGEGLTTSEWRKTCLLNQLTSISFSSSWRDDEFSDCFITMHYATPIEDIAAWKIEAKKICIALNLTQLSGRSRKRVTLALDNECNSFIRDTVWMWPNMDQPSEWNVALQKPTHEVLKHRAYSVFYEKFEGAFFHPNARAMCRALEWMLSRLSMITDNGIDRKSMLEMYCGCGAHTVAISKTGILEKIVAVEYDARLVEACHRNVVLNQSNTVDEDARTTPIDIVLADASMWAQNEHHTANKFDILLVDPPRQGLDEFVCQMAIDGLFQHILYISCGHEALVRDLAFLSPHYRAVNCTLLDLFPQTSSVESLVHLVRKGQ